MDQRLTWMPQVNYILECSRRPVGAVGSVYCRNEDRTYNAVETAYRVVVESKILNGLSGWLTASDHGCVNNQSGWLLDCRGTSLFGI